MLLQAADAHVDATYLVELLDRAEALGLAERREWHALLHYHSAVESEGVVSDADDFRFFLAPTGKTDPQAELAATLRAFLSADLVGGDPQSAQCAFIARYRWLKTELDFDDRRLPRQPCERFQHWFAELNAESATLVFASAYLNNPASLFGHVLLRLDRHGQTEATRLLAYSINYAADAANRRGLMYAIDGISGGFRGRFDIQPYYKLVQTYSDLESRDIWEYRLHLRPSQLQRLLEHVWELRGIEFDYYFLRENCAWQLLTLLEVADPNIRLSDELTLWALPADTIRLLNRQPGLIGEVTARPARGTAIRRRQQALSADERRLVWRLRDDPEAITIPAFSRLPSERQALLLELALDQHRYQRTHQSKGEMETLSDEIAHRLLTARHRLAVAATPIAVEPYATRPEAGHASRRLGISLGQRGGKAFVELAARASVHDLLEPDAGYTPNAQIEVLSVAIRHYPDHGRLQLDHLTLLDITSLTPFDELMPSPAWRIHAGWQSIPRLDCVDCRAFNLSGGLGLATETQWPWRILWFGLPELAFDYSGDFINAYRAGWSMAIGVALQPAANWKILIGASRLDYRFGEAGTVWRATVGQNLALGRNWALRIEWGYLEELQELAVGLRAYF